MKVLFHSKRASRYQHINIFIYVDRELYFFGINIYQYSISWVYLKAGSQRKSPLITPAVLECVHMHIYCLIVNLAGCFLDFYACCKC